MNYLLDTCVISELTAKLPNERVISWIDHIDDERLFLSVITIGEIARGISRLPESKRKKSLDEWLRGELLIRFQNRILPLTTEVMLTWGKLLASRRTLPAVDSMIAATVLYHDLFLVTRNVKDFKGTDVKLVNPWES
ncbi:MAG: type II toxin-antitoxin system VapC family toxin [Caldilineaceae bacterium]|nr:type II toxin-antitoxin system VapC family toxin [Caldilineaceae bacterium]MCB0127228.1 type II toxin-antitoxin system VapC family toxin [Caldilineaceae bacterium]MCB0189558.1 type II toxin-antitoxin system VapC family toxin [Caldilineaceae bacterium]